MSPVPARPLSAIKLYRGVSIYQVKGSQNWSVRIWDSERQQYVVKATGEDSVARAREFAKNHALSLLKEECAVEREFTFRHFAIKCLTKNSSLATKGERNSNYARVIAWAIQNDDWGLVRKFGEKDVRTIKTPDVQRYLEELSRKRTHLSSSTKNTILAAFRNVLKVARDEGGIDRIQILLAQSNAATPDPFFAFIRSSRRTTTFTRRCWKPPNRWQKKMSLFGAFLSPTNFMT